MSNPATAPAKAPAASATPAEQDRPEQRRGVLSWCNQNERTIRRWSIVVTNIAQVATLIVVGMWSMHRFKQSEEPSLKPHLRTGIHLKWVRIPKAKDRCMAELTLSLENPSKQSIEITQVHVKGWLTTISSKEHPPFIADAELRQGKLFVDQTFTGTDSYLLGPLQPGGSVNNSFLFQLGNDPTKRVHWEAEFDAKAQQDLGYRPWASEWDFVCNYKN